MWNKAGSYPDSTPSPLHWHQSRSVGVMKIIHAKQAGFEPGTFCMRGEYYTSEPHTPLHKEGGGGSGWKKRPGLKLFFI